LAAVESSTVKGFVVEGMTPADFVRRVERALAASGLDRNTDVRLRGDEIVVSIRWLGTSQLRYRVVEDDHGFRACPLGQSVSPFHSAFSGAFDDRFDEILRRVGARPLTT
jgi:hypothetical protein